MKRRIDQLKRTTEEETEEAKKKVHNNILVYLSLHVYGMPYTKLCNIGLE